MFFELEIELRAWPAERQVTSKRKESDQVSVKADSPQTNPQTSVK